MKKVLFLLLFNFAFGSEILMINSKIKNLDVVTIPKQYIEKFDVFEPYDGKYESFEGISLKNLVLLYGKKSNGIKIKAIDDFTSTFTSADIADPKWIFVFKKDGQFLTFDNKGPARIIDKSLKKDNAKHTFFDKWIWMIVEVEFK